ncbi:hypothetical protein BCR41DRAFT_353479, partial [Lobosporangium transversale]
MGFGRVTFIPGVLCAVLRDDTVTASPLGFDLNSIRTVIPLQGGFLSLEIFVELVVIGVNQVDNFRLILGKCHSEF